MGRLTENEARKVYFFDFGTSFSRTAIKAAEPAVIGRHLHVKALRPFPAIRWYRTTAARMFPTPIRRTRMATERATFATGAAAWAMGDASRETRNPVSPWAVHQDPTEPVAKVMGTVMGLPICVTEVPVSTRWRSILSGAVQARDQEKPERQCPLAAIDSSMIGGSA